MSIQALLELSRNLHEARTLADAMDHVVAAIERNTRYKRAWLVLPMSATKGIEVIGYALADRARVDQRMAQLDIKADRWLHVHLNAVEPFVRDDLREEPLADQRQVEYFGNRTLISVPMLRVAERIGALCVGTFASEGVMPPTPAELEFIVQVGAMISVVASRIRAEAANRLLEEKAGRSQRLELLGRVAGEIAHDFNNVLVSILCNAELARRMVGTHPAREYLDELEASASRATRLTRQLLSFSRGQAPQRRVTSLEAVIGPLMPMLKGLLSARVVLAYEPSADAASAYVDPGQIEQVVMNLVVNARDALPNGGQIRLTTQRVSVDGSFVAKHPEARLGEFVALEVSDTGVGIAEDVRAHIFEPFFTTKGPESGTGLGLAVVEGIVKRHEGFISIDSELGKGTTFRVFVPLGSGVPLEAPAPETQSGRLQGTEHVLVVDADAQVRRLLSRMLVNSGYRVTLADEADAALNLLDSHSDVAVALVDLMQLGPSGTSLRTALHNRREATPLVVMTGSGTPQANDGFEHVITKPFTSRDLLQLLRKALDAQRGATDRALPALAQAVK